MPNGKSSVEANFIHEVGCLCVLNNFFDVLTSVPALESLIGRLRTVECACRTDDGSPDTPLALLLDRQPVDRVGDHLLVPILVLGLDALVVRSLLALLLQLLGEVLAQVRLVAFGLCRLFVEVVQTDVIARLAEDLVLLGSTELRLLLLADLALGLLLQLVGEWDEEVPLPQAVLVMLRRQAGLRKEALVLGRQL